MRILIVSATLAETSFLLNDILVAKPGTIFLCTAFKHPIEILITGVGMTMTAFHLGNCLATKQYDLIVNIGLAGAFNRDLKLGEVVNVTCDSFADIGAEAGLTFIDLYDLKLADKNEPPFKNGKLVASRIYQQHLLSLKKVEAISVNTVHGMDESINRLLTYCTPDIETMEGAAFMYACLFHKTNCVQLRSISNYVEKRDKSKWDIPLAVEQLKLAVIKFLNDVS